MYKLDSARVDVSQTEARHSGTHSQRVGQLEVAVVVGRLVLDGDLQRPGQVVAVADVDDVSTHSELRVRYDAERVVGGQ